MRNTTTVVITGEVRMKLDASYSSARKWTALCDEFVCRIKWKANGIEFARICAFCRTLSAGIMTIGTIAAIDATAMTEIIDATAAIAETATTIADVIADTETGAITFRFRFNLREIF